MDPATDLDTEGMSLEELADAATECTACELYRDATQVVFGDGEEGAWMMILGEQPGDSEDREGEPFVGPSGRELSKALSAAGIERSEIYITNVVKHFRFETRGERRLHKTPTRRHVAACRPWLDAEIARIQPRVIVCLGGSAAKSILGPRVKVLEDHGVPQQWEDQVVIPTIHPSFILRSASEGGYQERFDVLVADLIKAAEIARRGSGG